MRPKITTAPDSSILEKINMGRKQNLDKQALWFHARPQTRALLASIHGRIAAGAGADVVHSLVIGRALVAYDAYLDALEADGGAGFAAELEEMKKLAGRVKTRKDGRL